MTTLRKLHEELNITQRLSLYVKNQNKKYKPNEPFTADEELSKTMETLIRINTLGKLGRHMEQARVISKATNQEERKNMKLAQAISDNTSLKIQLSEAKRKAQRAEKIVNNANMRDYIIKLYRVALKFGKNEPRDEEMIEIGEKYTKAGFAYLSNHDLYKIVYEEVKKLEKYLQQKEGK